MSRWIEHWEPEKPEFWESTGKRIARKNLALSIFAENLGFSVWVLMSIVVLILDRGCRHGRLDRLRRFERDLRFTRRAWFSRRGGR